MRGVEAIIELKGALYTLEYGDGSSELSLEQQAEARRMQRALRQAMHTAFFNQLAIAKNEAVDNNLKDGIDLHKGILKRSPGLPAKDKTAKGLELKAPAESETPTNPILASLGNILHMRTAQSLETPPEPTLDDLRQHIPEKRIRDFIEKVYRIQSRTSPETYKVDSQINHLLHPISNNSKQNEERVAAVLAGALPATKDLMSKMIEHLEEYLETLSQQDPKRYADLAYLGKSEANSLNTL